MVNVAKATFFTVGDARYFPGIVGLVNSLRVVGHSEEIVVLDCGFTQAQRRALGATCTIVELPLEERNATNPTYYKLVAPRLREFAEDDVIVVIDSDIVVTARLDELIKRASTGQLAAFPDTESDRWYSEWENIFSLSSPPRRAMYFCAGLLVFSPEQLPDLISKWWDRCQSIADQPTVQEGGVGPTSQADQDALNATLMSEYPPDTVYYEDIDRCPVAADLRRVRRRVTIVDRPNLSCTFEGKACIALHSSSHPKPWLTSRDVRRNAYSVLLADMLTRPGLAMTIPRDDVPFWLRDGLREGFAFRLQSLLSVTKQLFRDGFKTIVPDRVDDRA